MFSRYINTYFDNLFANYYFEVFFGDPNEILRIKAQEERDSFQIPDYIYKYDKFCKR